MARLEIRRRVWHAVKDIPKGAQQELGKRRFVRSTGKRDKKEAEVVAALYEVQWLRQIHDAIHGNATSEDLLEVKAELWRRRIALSHGEPSDHLLEQMKDEARELLDPFDPNDERSIRDAELFVEIALGEHQGTKDRLEEYLSSRSDLAPKTLQMYRASLELFCDVFPKVSDVTSLQVTSWIRDLRKAGQMNNTVQRSISAARGYWKFLQDEGLVPVEFDPFKDAKAKSQPRGRQAGKAESYIAFEPDEVANLYLAAQRRSDQRLADLIWLGMWTGCRIESLCSLRVEHVKDDTIQVNDKSDAGNRSIPIHSRLKPRIDELCQTSSDGFVISGLSENKYGQRSNALGKRFGTLKNNLGYKGRQRSFHSIRKTVVTQLERAGVPETTTMDIVGHEKPSMTYGLYSSGTSIDQRREAIEQLRYPVPIIEEL